MQKRLAVGKGVKILDQKTREGGFNEHPPCQLKGLIITLFRTTSHKAEKLETTNRFETLLNKKALSFAYKREISKWMYFKVTISYSEV